MPEHSAPRTSQIQPELVAVALAQLDEDARVYNRAIGSFNTHLRNHRERRDLSDLPFRAPISSHEAYPLARAGDREAIEALLAHLLNEAHLDSAVRRHPRVYPIHLEAIEYIEIARDQVVRTLEGALRYLSTQ